MASTPPRVSGSPQEEAHRRWVEEQIRDLQGQSSTAQKRVKAVESQASTAGSLASSTSFVATKLDARTEFPTDTNRFIRPTSDLEYWSDVIAERRSTFDGRQSVARNMVVDTASSVIYFIPTTEEPAEIHVTGINPVPVSGMIYIDRFQSPGLGQLEYWIEWRNSVGDIVNIPGIIEPTLVVSDITKAHSILLTGGYAYSVRVVRAKALNDPPMATDVAVLRTCSIFEVIGQDGLAVSPGGISVEDPDTGDKTVEINPSLPLLAAPSAPILTSSVGSVSVRWDGLLTSGAAPAHLDYVFAEEGTSSTGPWVRTGQPLKRAGDIITRPPVGDTRWYRFTAMDTSGRPSTQSLTASITVEGVDIPDLSGEIGDIIDTVDGLNKIFYQTIDAIPEAHANGDLWFVLDADSLSVVEVRIWNGSIWNPYRIVADSVVVPGSVGTITLADGVITAPKVKLRELEGEHFKVGSISVDELTPNIGSYLDISINPSLSDVQDGLEQQQRRFRFDENGLEIGDPATDEALRLSPGRIEMVQGGNVPTWWEAQNFYVERMIVQAANIGSHRFEGYANGRTVIRPLRGV